MLEQNGEHDRNKEVCFLVKWPQHFPILPLQEPFFYRQDQGPLRRPPGEVVCVPPGACIGSYLNLDEKIRTFIKSSALMHRHKGVLPWEYYI